jgi:hypothetical protein
MLELSKSVMEQPAVNILRSWIREPAVFGTITSAVITAVAALVAALIKAKWGFLVQGSRQDT